jgi:hypothetical protein
LTISIWFSYTRLCLPIYEVNGNTLIYKNSVYVRKDALSTSDEENLGKTIGIALDGERTITEFIWPVWVMEYKNRKDHNYIFVKGFMDLGTVYEKD